MKRKNQIDGICSGGCVTKIKETLEEYPAIEKTEIFLKPKGATIITMRETLSVDELQKQLNTVEDYTITEIN